jgi:hypothetical protein
MIPHSAACCCSQHDISVFSLREKAGRKKGGGFFFFSSLSTANKAQHIRLPGLESRLGNLQ